MHVQPDSCIQPAQRTDGRWANRRICCVALVEKANVLSPFVLVVQTSLPWGSLMPLQFVFNPDGFWYSESGGICCATGEKKLKKRSWTTSKLCEQMGIFRIWLEGRLLMEVPAHMVKIHLLHTHTVCNWPLCRLLYAMLGVMMGGSGRNCLQELLQPFPSSCKGLSNWVSGVLRQYLGWDLDNCVCFELKQCFKRGEMCEISMTAAEWSLQWCCWTQFEFCSSHLAREASFLSYANPLCHSPSVLK